MRSRRSDEGRLSVSGIREEAGLSVKKELTESVFGYKILRRSFRT